MRYWTIRYPERNALGEEYTKVETLSERQVLDYMRRAFYDKRLITGASDGLDLITPEFCIEDWVVAHRAVRNPWIEMKDCIA